MIFVSCFRGRKYHKARSEKRQREYYENLVAQNNMRPIAAPPPLEDIASNIQEEYAVVASPPLVALPDPTAENDVQVEQIRALKRKLRHAVTVANGCARVLEDERAENSEQIRKLRWALRLERDAHQKKKDNPLGHPLLPTHAEIQERLAEDRAREARFEHKRQALIEENLRMKLAEKIEREKEEEQRAKEEAAELARRNRPKTPKEIESRRKLALAALALAVSRGRTCATLGDYRECNGVPRLVSESRKNVSK